MEKFLIIKHRKAAGKVKEEGSQSPTPHIPAALTPETMSVTPNDVAPSTSVDGEKLNQDEAAIQGEELVIYGQHLPAKKCGAYRKKLSELRREAVDNLRPPVQQGQVQTACSQGTPKRKKGEIDTLPLVHWDDKRLQGGIFAP